MLEFINNVMQKFGLGGMISDSAIAKIVQGGLEKVSNGISKIDPNLGQKMKELSEKLSEGKTDEFVSGLKEMKEGLKQDSKYSAVYSELTDFFRSGS